jgi:hypothetical protein
MSNKLPEVIFTALSKDGALSFTTKEQLSAFCREHDQEELLVYLKPAAKGSEKMKLYAFYHVNVLQCAVMGYTYAGYPGIDAVKADYLLRAEFAKDFIQKPDGTYIPVMLDKRGMTKARLLKYVTDCIFFIETELQQRVPESEEWKLKVKTGRNFKRVTND